MSKPLERFSGFFSLEWTHNVSRAGFPVPQFRFAQYMADPLTFHCLDGSQVRPASRFAGFDFGSVPGRLQSLVPALCSPRAFVFHDSAFQNHGHWVSKDGGISWVFVSLSQHEANHWLYLMMNVEGNPVRRCWLAFEGVQVGGSDVWRKHTGPFPVDPGY
jgi:hypothetical protein